jgi:hypothetical protein
MRLRVCVATCALATLGSLAAAGLAGAAPQRNHHLTIAAVPNPILAGEGVLIYGRLLGVSQGNQRIVLYHHLGGSDRGFTVIGATRTDANGFYEFERQEGLVYTNRQWFVRGPGRLHSRTIRERVAALVTLNPSTTASDTSQPIVFTGHVTPNHAYQRVLLQRQDPATGNWATIARGVIGPGSNYVIVRRLRLAGAYGLRAVVRRDARNIRSVSDTVNVVVQQAQIPGFSINTSTPLTDEGGSTTISGVLDQPGTNTPEPNTLVQLWGRTPDHRPVVLADGVTGADGSYSFTQSGLTTNTVYHVATMRLPHVRRRHTARLYEGVRDLVTMQANESSANTGQMVTFTGTVLPDKAGHRIDLQKLGKDGNWHTVEVSFVRNDSSFTFNWVMGSPRTYTFRARIPSDERNIGSSSAPVSVTATLPSVTSLPPAS